MKRCKDDGELAEELYLTFFNRLPDAKEKAKAKMIFRLRGMFEVVVLFTGFVFCLKILLVVVQPLAAVFRAPGLAVCGFESLPIFGLLLKTALLK